jgi:predicted Zn finger-like uncharacterized protein
VIACSAQKIPCSYKGSVLEFVSFGAHIAVSGGADMPLTGEVTPGETFYCPHCGALYVVTHSRLPASDSNIAKCVVCGTTMDARKSTTVPSEPKIGPTGQNSAPFDLIKPGTVLLCMFRMNSGLNGAPSSLVKIHSRQAQTLPNKKGNRRF